MYLQYRPDPQFSPPRCANTHLCLQRATSEHWASMTLVTSYPFLHGMLFWPFCCSYVCYYWYVSLLCLHHPNIVVFPGLEEVLVAAESSQAKEAAFETDGSSQAGGQLWKRPQAWVRLQYCTPTGTCNNVGGYIGLHLKYKIQMNNMNDSREPVHECVHTVVLT